MLSMGVWAGNEPTMTPEAGTDEPLPFITALDGFLPSVLWPGSND